MILERTIALVTMVFIFFSCSKIDKKFYNSKDSNELRRRFHIPIIEAVMTQDESADLSDTRWATSPKFPRDTNVLHVWKAITAGRSILTFESDAFRKRIDDTLFYQLNVDSKFRKDSTVTVTGLVFYVMENESKSLSLDFDKKYKPLDSLGVDSVKKSWKLYY
ncbi:MAG: hypothetical protein NTW29_03170 [Bacteroidetes bacterium]|nr:hypothetical protein [Bacteroidota bacterium]